MGDEGILTFIKRRMRADSVSSARCYRVARAEILAIVEQVMREVGADCLRGVLRSERSAVPEHSGFIGMRLVEREFQWLKAGDACFVHSSERYLAGRIGSELHAQT